MGSTTPAPPEELRPAVSLDVEAPLPEISNNLTARAGHRVIDSSWVQDRGECYLRNSVLRI